MFSEREGHFLGDTKRKESGEGLENGYGVPSSYKTMAWQVGEAGKNRSGKGFSIFLKSNYQILSGTERCFFVNTGRVG